MEALERARCCERKIGQLALQAFSCVSTGNLVRAPSLALINPLGFPSWVSQHRGGEEFTDLRPLALSLGRKEARSSRSRRRRPHTSGPCSLDAPWYAAPSIRAQEQSHAHVARKSTPINSDRAFPPCAVSAPRRPSSRRLEKENLRVRGRGQRDGVRDTSQRRGIAKTAVGAFVQRQHSTAEEELLEVASSSMLEVSSARRASRSPAPWSSAWWIRTVCRCSDGSGWSECRAAA